MNHPMSNLVHRLGGGGTEEENKGKDHIYYVTQAF